MVEPDLQRLYTISGIKRKTAEPTLAEIDTDMSRFSTAKHLASWAGPYPGDCESAVKRYLGKTRKGGLFSDSPTIAKKKEALASLVLNPHE